ncbi:hypothetical protein KAR48_15205, partial [bacterium]|nr:hypothetical protein [bacterium]
MHWARSAWMTAILCLSVFQAGGTVSQHDVVQSLEVGGHQRLKSSSLKAVEKDQTRQRSIHAKVMDIHPVRRSQSDTGQGPQSIQIIPHTSVSADKTQHTIHIEILRSSGQATFKAPNTHVTLRSIVPVQSNAPGRQVQTKGPIHFSPLNSQKSSSSPNQPHFDYARFTGSELVPIARPVKSSTSPALNQNTTVQVHTVRSQIHSREVGESQTGQVQVKSSSSVIVDKSVKPSVTLSQPEPAAQNPSPLYTMITDQDIPRSIDAKRSLDFRAELMDQPIVVREEVAVQTSLSVSEVSSSVISSDLYDQELIENREQSISSRIRLESSSIKIKKTTISKSVSGQAAMPDLIVDDITTPTSLVGGTPFQVSYTIANAGDAATTQYFDYEILVDDNVIYTGTFNATLGVGYSGTFTLTFSNGLSAGLHTLGCRADSAGEIAESDETNNLRQESHTWTGEADLIVQDIHPPSTTAGGQPFTMDVTIANTGVRDVTDSFYLTLFLNGSWLKDYRISTDMPMRSSLKLGISFSGLPAGTHVFRFKVDSSNEITESSNSNNEREESFTFTGKPDLIVQDIGTPSSLAGGTPFTVAVTLKNQGGAHLTQDFDLDLYIDGTHEHTFRITTDFPMGSSGGLTVSFNGLPAGTHALKFFADVPDAVDEANDGNNWREESWMWTGKPDLIVQDVGTPSSLAGGTPFTVLVTLKNQGGAHLTQDFDLDVFIDGDKENTFRISTDFPMNATGSLTLSFSDLPAGDHTLGFLADAQDEVDEVINGNNYSEDSWTWTGKPDLIVQSISTPTSLEGGQPFAVTVSLKNQGVANITQNFDLDLYIDGSKNDTFRIETDFPMGASGTMTLNFSGLASGEHTLKFVADGANEIDEALESNNDKQSTWTWTGKPDLTIESINEPTNLEANQTFQITARIGNIGGESAAGGFDLGIIKDGTLVDTHEISQSMPSGSSVDVTVTFNGGFTAGQHTLTFEVDKHNEVVEKVESNNTASRTWTWSEEKLPDLLVQSVSDPTSLEAGGQFEITVTVVNSGEAVAGSGFIVAFFVDGSKLGQYTVNQSLSPNETHVETLGLSGFTAGEHHFRFVADHTGVIGESNEGNNEKEKRWTWTGQPDLRIEAITTPSNLNADTAFEMQVTVANRGNDKASGGFNVDILVDGSRQKDFRVTETFNPDDSRVYRVQFPAGLSAGTHRIAFEADADGEISESREDNNTKEQSWTWSGKPDLIVDEIGNPSTQEATQPFDITVRIANIGDELAPGGFKLGVRVNGILIDNVTISDNLSPGTQRDVTVSFSGLPAGTHTIIFDVDATAVVSESREDNNTNQGSWTWTGEPDLIVESISAPTSLEALTTFEITVTITNQGADHTMAGFDIDVLVDGDVVGNTRISSGLAAAQSKDVVIRFTNGLTAGEHEIGVNVDPGNAIHEKIEMNNSGSDRWTWTGVPDLIVSDLTNPSTLQANRTFNIQAQVANRGSQATGSGHKLGVYVDDGLVQEMFVSDILPVGGSKSYSIQFSNGLPLGEHHIGVMADLEDVIVEIQEDNNRRDESWVWTGKPDLTVTSIGSPSSLKVMTAFSLEFTIANVGAADAVGGFSIDVFIDGAIQETVRFHSDLSSQAEADIEVTFPNGLSRGSHTLGFRVDSGGEIDESTIMNNYMDRSWRWTGAPDLVVAAIGNPSTEQANHPFDIPFTIENKGDVGVVETIGVHVLLNGYPIDGLEFTEDLSAANQDGNAWQGTYTFENGLDIGEYQIGFFVDPYNNIPESAEWNNTKDRVVSFRGQTVRTLIVGNLSIKADAIVETGQGRYEATGNIWIGKKGESIYRLKLGGEIALSINLNRLTIEVSNLDPSQAWLVLNWGQPYLLPLAGMGNMQFNLQAGGGATLVFEDLSFLAPFSTNSTLMEVLLNYSAAELDLFTGVLTGETQIGIGSDLNFSVFTRFDLSAIHLTWHVDGHVALPDSWILGSNVVALEGSLDFDLNLSEGQLIVGLGAGALNVTESSGLIGINMVSGEIGVDLSWDRLLRIDIIESVNLQPGLPGVVMLGAMLDKGSYFQLWDFELRASGGFVGNFAGLNVDFGRGAITLDWSERLLTVSGSKQIKFGDLFNLNLGAGSLEINLIDYTIGIRGEMGVEATAWGSLLGRVKKFGAIKADIRNGMIGGTLKTDLNLLGGTLLLADMAVAIDRDGLHTWEAFNDINGNQIRDGGEVMLDINGNGSWDRGCLLNILGLVSATAVASIGPSHILGEITTGFTLFGYSFAPGVSFKYTESSGLNINGWQVPGTGGEAAKRILAYAVDDGVPITVQIDPGGMIHIDINSILPPVIVEGPVVTYYSDVRAAVQWSTDKLATTSIEYGEDTSYGQIYAPEGVSLDHMVILEGLQPDQRYHYQVISKDMGGEVETVSNDGLFQTGMIPDGIAPVSIQEPAAIAASYTSTVIYWETDEPSLGYIEYGSSLSFGQFIYDEAFRTRHWMTLHDLTPGETVYYRIGSTDPAGNGPALSNELTFVPLSIPDLTPPSITEAPQVINAAPEVVFIVWQTDEASDSRVTFGLNLPYSYTTQRGHYVTQHLVTLTGLAAGATYHYQVSSTDLSGNTVIYTADQQFTTLIDADGQNPVFTSGPDVEILGETTVSISWSTNERSNSVVHFGLTDACVETKEDGALVWQHRVVLTHLQPGSSYYYRITSQDFSGNIVALGVPEVFSTPVDLTPPVILDGPDITMLSDTEVTLLWRTNEPGGSGLYYGDTADCDKNLIDSSAVTDHHITVNGLKPERTYQYYVTTWDLNHNGPVQSDMLTWTTLPDTSCPVIESGPEVVTVTDCTAVIAWITDEAATSVVRYDQSTDFRYFAQDTSLNVEHDMLLTA